MGDHNSALGADFDSPGPPMRGEMSSLLDPCLSVKLTIKCGRYHFSKEYNPYCFRISNSWLLYQTDYSFNSIERGNIDLWKKQKQNRRDPFPSRQREHPKRLAIT